MQVAVTQHKKSLLPKGGLPEVLAELAGTCTVSGPQRSMHGHLNYHGMLLLLLSAQRQK